MCAAHEERHQFDPGSRTAKYVRASEIPWSARNACLPLTAQYKFLYPIDHFPVNSDPDILQNHMTSYLSSDIVDFESSMTVIRHPKKGLKEYPVVCDRCLSECFCFTGIIPDGKQGKEKDHCSETVNYKSN